MTVFHAPYRKFHPARLAGSPRLRSGKLRATLVGGMIAIFAAMLSSFLWQSSEAQVVPQRGPLGFNLSNAIIPRNEIHAGGPPKDGIPALSNPAMIRPNQATYLNPADRVAGVAIGDDARAYPLKILNYHELVNTQVGGVPILVTYCPLCDSVAVFDRRVDGRTPEFGVSGLLYNSNVLMYDRGGQPESLWSQAAAKAVSGPAAGKSLKALPVELTTWQDWRERHPNTTVLSDRTGHARNYNVNPYARYFAGQRLMFPVRPMSDRLPAKTLVLGVWTEGESRAYPLAAFGERDQTLDQELDGRRFRIAYDARHRSVRVVAAEEGVEWMYAFWFAWHAFRPETEVFAARR